ncbi:hypothetical protein CFP56_021858 [Quercus suber]|uniref:Uncharacterized protein n=1 Tax=Quercus suber TaxID=58331 RepID=A0AAW0KC59_QUESU
MEEHKVSYLRYFIVRVNIELEKFQSTIKEMEATIRYCYTETNMSVFMFMFGCACGPTTGCSNDHNLENHRQCHNGNAFKMRSREEYSMQSLLNRFPNHLLRNGPRIQLKNSFLLPLTK